MKKIIAIGYFFLVLISMTLLYLGVSSIFSAILIYSFIFLVAYRFLKITLLKNQNLKLLFWSVFVSICILETGIAVFNSNESVLYSHPSKSGELEQFIYYLKGEEKDFNYEAYPAHSSKVYSSKDEFSYLHKYNALGFRDKDYTQTEIQTSNVILCLGDSFTEGVGASEDSTWPAVLQSLLNESKYLAINTGVAGSDPLYEYYKLTNNIFQYYKPEIVILNINKTDVYDFIENGGVERFNQPSENHISPPPKWYMLYTLSPFIRIISFQLFGITEYGLDQNSTQLEAIVMKEMQKMILKFQEHASENSYQFIIVFHPLISELKSDKAFYFNTLHGFNLEHGIYSINLYDNFRKNEQLYWNNDKHLNSKGYAFFANNIKEYLLQLDMLVQGRKDH